VFWSLVAKEVRRTIFDYRFSLVLVLLVGASLTATVVQTHLHNRLLADYNLAADKRAMVYAKPSADKFGFAVGSHAEKRPGPLAIFCCGLENQLTRTLRADIWDNDRICGPKLGSLFFRTNFPLDISTVMEIVGSLLVLLLVYESVCGERESGTLLLLLSGPVPRHRIILATGAARIITLSIPFVLAWTASVSYVLLMTNDPLNAHQLIRVGLMAFGSWLYLLTFAAAGLAAGTACSRSATALAVCVLYWVVMALAAPALILHLSLNLAGGTPRAVVERELWDEQQKIYAGAQSRLAEEFRNGKDSVGVTLGSFMQTGSAMKGLTSGIAADQVNAMARQRALVRTLSALSPVTSYARLSTDLAGTGPEAYAMVQSYWQQVKDALYTDAQHRQPNFGPPAPLLREVMGDNAVQLLGLVVYSTLFLVVAFLLFLRRRIT
jgi:ABC-type transport system involved in multi-copper enzyme maturation permease subunit